VRCLRQVERSRPLRFQLERLDGGSVCGWHDGAVAQPLAQPSWASRPFSDPLTIRELSGLDVCSQAVIKVIPGNIAPDGKGLAEGEEFAAPITQGDIRTTVPASKQGLCGIKSRGPSPPAVCTALASNSAPEVLAATTLLTSTSESRSIAISPRARARTFAAKSGLRNRQSAEWTGSHSRRLALHTTGLEHPSWVSS
jgi:hypothetical protein